MGVLSDYTQGTITVTNGSKNFTGTGTLWRTVGFQEGDTVLLQGFQMVIEPGMIGSLTEQNLIEGNTVGKFTENWPGTTGTFSYRMRYQANDSRLSAKAQNLLEAIASGNITAIGELEGFENALIQFTGPGTVTLIDKKTLTNGVQYNAYVETLPELDQYAGAAEGFAVLVGDIGDGRSALYIKRSVTIGDWFDPAIITGPVGPLASINVGTTTTTAPGTDATVVNSGTPTAPVLDFGIPAGKGFYNEGDYSALVTYTEGDVVQYNGSSWIAKQTTTGNAPPAPPATNNANWQLLARVGDGGDMYKSVYDPTNQNKDIFAEINNRLAFDILQAKTDAEKGQARANASVDIVSGFRNKIINGNFDVWQRGTNFSGNVFTADRWRSSPGNSSTVTVSRQVFSTSDILINEGKTFFLRWARTVAGSSETTLSNKLENVRTLANKRVTITFWANTNVTTFLTPKLEQNFGTDGGASASVYFNFGRKEITPGWKKYTYATTIPSISGKVLGSNNHLNFYFGWANTDPNATIDLSTISLVEGDATKEENPSENRSLQAEIALCQRYYTVQDLFFGVVATAADQSLNAPVYWQVPMRITPTTSFFSSNSPSNTKSQNLYDTTINGTKYECVSIAAGRSTSAFLTIAASAEYV